MKVQSTLLTKEFVPGVVLGGNATITLQSGNTGRFFTYKIKRSEKHNNLYFINLLIGTDNENDYSYIGCYYSDTEYFHAAKQWKDKNRVAWPKSLRAISFLFDKLHNVPDNLYVYNNGKCACCGRKLTTPESIQRGIGPECYKRR